ncbi:MAG: hypothetical protein ACR2LJ_09030 [Acidimicrobiales bacterium]
MGQLITVTRKPTTKAGVAVFDLNRSLTGMGHERYRSPEVTGHRPVDELARRLFATGAVTAVHVYSNVVTVELSEPAGSGGKTQPAGSGGKTQPGSGGEGLDEVIRDLFTYYREGVEVANPLAMAAEPAAP